MYGKMSLKYSTVLRHIIMQVVCMRKTVNVMQVAFFIITGVISFFSGMQIALIL